MSSYGTVSTGSPQRSQTAVVQSGDHSSTDDVLETPFASDLDTEPEARMKADHTPGVLERSVSGLPSRLSNVFLRIVMTVVMISGFSFLVWLGPLALVFLVGLTTCFRSIAYK